MIKGKIHRSCPLVNLQVVWSQTTQDVEAIIDTGFTGEIKVPPQMIDDLGLKVTHTQQVTLGDSRKVDFLASVAYVSLDGIKNLVNVLVAPGDVLIGVELLQKFKMVLNADFKKNSLILYKSE